MKGELRKVTTRLLALDLAEDDNLNHSSRIRSRSVHWISNASSVLMPLTHVRPLSRPRTALQVRRAHIRPKSAKMVVILGAILHFRA